VPGEAREGRRGAAEEVVRSEFRGLLDYEARAGRTEAVAQGSIDRGVAASRRVRAAAAHS
jgi:hypothetical protein